MVHICLNRSLRERRLYENYSKSNSTVSQSKSLKSELFFPCWTPTGTSLRSLSVAVLWLKGFLKFCQMVYLSDILWVGFLGVWVSFLNSSSNLIMNLWNLFSQLLLTVLQLAETWHACFQWNANTEFSLFWMRMKTNINLSIKLIFQKTLFQLHWSTILRKSKHCLRLLTPLIVPCNKK